MTKPPVKFIHAYFPLTHLYTITSDGLVLIFHQMDQTRSSKVKESLELIFCQKNWNKNIFGDILYIIGFYW
ncbi:hypothetical protein MtrunA17_Chr5g0403341 [Medicago truncatula]|uniref:Uncharacterized protein n=1 Tax=Medicago truncatula TaxID=3880 RepID=A0A396HLD9_MEDTR|nr:hypothetical protein MtrunA17_Chr5g0403341 [Medicago truncatula]